MQLRPAPASGAQRSTLEELVRSGPNLRGLNRTVKALVLEESDQALLALARSLARAVDVDPCGDCGAIQTAALWKEYRATVLALLEAGTPDDVDDETAAFRLTIQTPVRAKVVNTPES